MFIDLTKYYFIILIGLYISFKLLKQKSKSHKSQILLIIYSLVLALLTIVFTFTFPLIAHLVPIVFLWVFESIYTSHPQISFIVVTISLGISYCIHGFSSFISTVLIYSLGSTKENFAFLAVLILATILHCIFSFALFKIKRFKNGLPLIHSPNYVHIST